MSQRNNDPPAPEAVLSCAREQGESNSEAGLLTVDEMIALLEPTISSLSTSGPTVDTLAMRAAFEEYRGHETESGEEEEHFMGSPTPLKLTPSEGKRVVLMAALCKSTYDEPSKIEEDWKGMFEVDVVEVPFKDDALLRAIVVQDKSKVVVAFRGTAGSDAIFDVLFHQVQWLGNKNKYYGGPWVHLGFFAAASVFFQKLADRVTTWGEEQTDIYVTGHSLGGAIGHLFTLYLKRLKAHTALVKQLTTFGQPRTGNPYFAHKLTHRELSKTEYLRCQAEGDFVSELIFRTMPSLIPLFYRHSSRLLRLGGKDKGHGIEEYYKSAKAKWGDF